MMKDEAMKMKEEDEAETEGRRQSGDTPPPDSAEKSHGRKKSLKFLSSFVDVHCK